MRSASFPLRFFLVAAFAGLGLSELPSVRAATTLTDLHLQGTGNKVESGAELTINSGGTLTGATGSVVDLFNSTVALPDSLSLKDLRLLGSQTRVLSGGIVTFLSGSTLMADAGSSINLSATTLTLPSNVVLTTGPQTLVGKTFVDPVVASLSSPTGVNLSLVAGTSNGAGLTLSHGSEGMITLLPGGSAPTGSNTGYSSVNGLIFSAAENLTVTAGTGTGGGTKALRLYFPTAHRSGAPWVITSDTTSFGGPAHENDTIFLWGFNAIAGGNKVVDTGGVTGARKFYHQMEHDYYQSIGNSASRMDEWHLNAERDDGVGQRLFQLSYFPSSGTTSTGWSGSFQVFESGSLNTGRSSWITKDNVTAGSHFAVRNAADTADIDVLKIDGNDRTTMGFNGQGIVFNKAPLRLDGNLDNESLRPAATITPRPGEIWGHSRHTPGNVDGFLRLSAGGGSDASTKTYLDITGFSSVPDMDRAIVAFAQGAERFRISGIGAKVTGFLTLSHQNSPPPASSGSSSLYFDSSNRLSWKGADGYVRSFDTSSFTADRVFSLPNTDGAVVLATATQTLSGKTLSSPVIDTPVVSTPTISGTISIGSGAGTFISAAPNSPLNLSLLPSAQSSSSTITLFNSTSAGNATYGQLTMGAGNGREFRLSTGHNGSAPAGDISFHVDGVGEMLRLNASGEGITTGQPFVSNSTQASVSTSTGSLRLSGGAGIAGAINVGGTGTFGSRIRIATDYTNANEVGFYNGTNSILYGLIGIAAGNGAHSSAAEAQDLVIRSQANLRIAAGGSTDRLSIRSSDGSIAISSLTAATSTTTGALTVAGGVGVQKKLFVGDDMSLIPTAATAATVRLSGTAVADTPGLWFRDGGTPTAANVAVAGTASSTIVNAPAGGSVSLRVGDTGYVTVAPSAVTLASVPLRVTSSTASISTTTGSATFAGGIGVAGRTTTKTLSVGGGSAVDLILTALTTLDFPSIAPNGGVQDLTVSVPGASLADAVNVVEGAGAFAPAGLVLRGIVTAANTVTVRATNVSPSAIDPASLPFRVTVTSF